VSLRLTPKFVFNLVETVDVGLNGTKFSIARNEARTREAYFPFRVSLRPPMAF
jgi:hypothetical protein